MTCLRFSHAHTKLHEDKTVNELLTNPTPAVRRLTHTPTLPSFTGRRYFCADSTASLVRLYKTTVFKKKMKNGVYVKSCEMV